MNIVAADVVEVAPAYDHADITASGGRYSGTRNYLCDGVTGTVEIKSLASIYKSLYRAHSQVTHTGVVR